MAKTTNAMAPYTSSDTVPTTEKRQENEKQKTKNLHKKNNGNGNVKMRSHIKRQLEYKCGSQSGIGKK